MKSCTVKALFFALAITICLGCETSGSQSDGTDTNADTDTDTDSDADTDTDTDVDTDADTDIDTDSDTDSDTDVDIDSDSDTDADGDTETEHDDQDSDGWIGEIDCDDTNPNANQGETEIPGNKIDDDCDGLTDEGDSGLTGDLHGTVWSPSGTIPISGALIYLTQQLPAAIPDEVFDYQNDDMTGLPYTLSAADGTWSIADAPTGDWYIVTRKGNFRRIREVAVEEDVDLAVPQDDTTLPPDDTPDALDTIPNFALLLTYPDLVLNLLAKFGMGEVDANGDLVYGTETFDLFTNRTVVSGYPATADLFESQETVDQYHMLFFP